MTAFGGRPYLIGRIDVHQILGRQEAESYLGTDDLWDAGWYAVAKHETACRVQKVDLQSMIADIRFKSDTGKDRLDVVSGRINGRQLQAMRRLTATSSDQLSALLDL